MRKLLNSAPSRKKADSTRRFYPIHRGCAKSDRLLEWSLPTAIWGEPLSPRAVCVATAILLIIARPLTAWATGEDFGWIGISTFGASFSEGQGFYGSSPERAGEDFASLDSNDGSVRVDGKIITFPWASADAQVDDSRANVSSFKLDLNAVPVAVRDDDFVDSVVQDYLKFLASGASDSYGGTPGFWSDHLVALSFGLTPSGNSGARIRAGCSSDGSSSAVIRCEIFQAVFSNFAPN